MAIRYEATVPLREPWEAVFPKCEQALGILGFRARSWKRPNEFVRGAWWGPLVSFSPRSLPRRILFEPEGGHVRVDDLISMFAGLVGRADGELLRAEFDDVIHVLRTGQVSPVDRDAQAAEVSKISVRVAKKFGLLTFAIFVADSLLPRLLPGASSGVSLALDLVAGAGWIAVMAMCWVEYKNAPSPQAPSIGYQSDRLGLGPTEPARAEDERRILR